MAVSVATSINQERNRTQDATKKINAFNERMVSYKHFCTTTQVSVIRIQFNTLSESAKSKCQKLSDRIVETNSLLLDRIRLMMSATINVLDECNQYEKRFVQCVTQQQDRTAAQNELHTFITDILNQNTSFNRKLASMATNFSKTFTTISTDIIETQTSSVLEGERSLFVKYLNTLREYTSLQNCLTAMAQEEPYQPE